MLTMLAERRNSPSSGRPSTSSRTVWVRFPCATAAMARVTSVGWAQQILHQRIDRDFHLAPGASGFVKARALAGLAFLADDLPDALQFLRPSAGWRRRFR